MRERIFGIGQPSGMLGNPIVASAVERMLGLSDLEAIYQRLPRCENAAQFVDAALSDLDLRAECSREEIERIPQEGSLIVVANHPFGGVEGLLLAQLLERRRPDLKIMANDLLARIPELRELFIFVDPWMKAESHTRNARALRNALRHVREGGALAIFPAGEVAHYEPNAGAVIEPPWQPSVGRIVQAAKAPVVPVCFHGQNMPAFHLAGLVHASLRTALLPHALLSKRGRRIPVRVGRAIAPRSMPKIGAPALAAYLRDRTEVLRFRLEPETRALPSRALEPIAAAIKPEWIAADIDALPEAQVLLRSGANRVLWARAAQIPNALLEIGRLREITFRAIGEGTGKPRDLDRFDASYRHLFLWNEQSREIIGAYRIGLVDELLAESGRAGIYSSTLFDLHPSFFKHVGASIDLGRSFVRPEQQGSPTALLLLWKGIGRIVSLEPRYRYLFGPCSISDAYAPLSRDLMIGFLEREHGTHLRELVRPRLPLPARSAIGEKRVGRSVSAWIRDLRDLSSWVSHVEPDEKGVPILLQHYVRVGGKLLGFNVDPAFKCVDGFVLVDLLDTPRRTLELFMGEARVAELLAHHTPAKPGKGTAACASETLTC